MSVNIAEAKQRCFDIIERFPSGQLAMLANSLENMYKMIDEAADMAFCVGLSERHELRDDKDEPGVPFEDFVKELGFTMEDIADADD